MKENIFYKSVLVVAHPDDEILWFSSVISKVDLVIICFLGNPKVPGRREARIKVLSDYPMDNVQSLDIDVPLYTEDVDWPYPVESEHGLYVKSNKGRKQYMESYSKVKRLLKERLQGFKNVFTHSPWGEYGHSAHIQVHRIVYELSNEYNYKVWFPNYVSWKSVNLALKYLKGEYDEPVSLPTNTDLAQKIQELYIKSDCWTVPEGFVWHKEEKFNYLPDKQIANKNNVNYPFSFNLLEWGYDPLTRNISLRSIIRAFIFKLKTCLKFWP
jgi:hypothetical protein